MIKQSDLAYQGMVWNMHWWLYGGESYYWRDKGHKVYTGVDGKTPFCAVTLPAADHAKPRTIKPLTRTDAKRAIVETLNATAITGVAHE